MIRRVGCCLLECVRCRLWWWLLGCRCGCGVDLVFWGGVDDIGGEFLDVRCCFWGCGDCCLDGDEFERDVFVLEFGVVLLVVCILVFDVWIFFVSLLFVLFNVEIFVFEKRKCKDIDI